MALLEMMMVVEEEGSSVGFDVACPDDLSEEHLVEVEFHFPDEPICSCRQVEGGDYEEFF